VMGVNLLQLLKSCLSNVRNYVCYNENVCASFCWIDIKKRKLSDELIDQELSTTRLTTSRQTSTPDLPQNIAFDLYDFTGRTVRVRALLLCTESCHVNGRDD